MGKEDAWLKEILDGLGDLGPPWEALLAKIKDWPLFVGYTISAEKFRLETAVGDEFTKQELRQRGIQLHESLFREMEKKGIIRTVRKKKGVSRRRKRTDKECLPEAGVRGRRRDGQGKNL